MISLLRFGTGRGSAIHNGYLRAISWLHQNRLVPGSRLNSSGSKIQLLYEHQKPRQILLARAFAASQIIIWPFMYYTSLGLLKKRETIPRNPEADKSKYSHIARNVAEGNFPQYTANCCVLIGFTLSVVALFFARQSVKRIELVGRSRALIETYGILRAKKFDLNVEKVSALRGRHAGSSLYLPLKVAGEQFYIFVDQSAGHFPLPKLFDMTVGITRHL